MSAPPRYAGKLHVAHEGDTDGHAALPPAGTWFYTCYQQPHDGADQLHMKLTNGGIVYEGAGEPWPGTCLCDGDGA